MVQSVPNLVAHRPDNGVSVCARVSVCAKADLKCLHQSLPLPLQEAIIEPPASSSTVSHTNGPLRLARVYGFRNIQTLLRQAKAGRCQYHYVEVGRIGYEAVKAVQECRLARGCGLHWRCAAQTCVDATGIASCIYTPCVHVHADSNLCACIQQSICIYCRSWHAPADASTEVDRPNHYLPLQLPVILQLQVPFCLPLPLQLLPRLSRRCWSSWSVFMVLR